MCGWGVVENLYLLLFLVGGAVLMLDAFSLGLQRVSVPMPLAALLYGVLIGPHALDLLRLEMFSTSPHRLLEEVARLTLAVSLTGVALRLPHGYWRHSVRWIVVIIGLGMAGMWAVATGLVWAFTDMPFLVALAVGAIITPTDPVVSTPIVTGDIATEQIPARVRQDISSESGLNDGMAFLFVILPVLLLTSSSTGHAWREWLVGGLLREIVGACLGGVVIGYLVGTLCRWVLARDLMEETAYSGFVIAMALFTLGAFRILGVNAILGVFIAAAVFGQVIAQDSETDEDRESEIISRFFTIPVFILLGMALPLDAWASMGPTVALAMAAALILRRVIVVWLLRPLLAPVHSRAETAFLGWFAAVGVSALYYALFVERETGRSDVFTHVTLVITLSLVIHGITATPFGAWLKRQGEGARSRQS